MISSIFAMKGPITRSIFCVFMDTIDLKSFHLRSLYVYADVKGSRHATLPALEDGVTI